MMQKVWVVPVSEKLCQLDCTVNTVKPAYVVTSIKGSHVLSSHFFGSLEPKYSANEHVLRDHLS